jgi:oxygen-independent coproporphyrinogen-3 oxidase
MTCDLKQKILGLDARVPRYTSYPTAPHFKPVDDDQTYLRALKKIDPDDPLSLYIHVPFCPKLCWYCGCNTKITRRYTPVENYIQLLLTEIDILAGSLKQKRTLSHIHFGGGSPSYVQAVDFAQIMEKLNAAFYIHDDTEIALEIDPRNVSEGRIATYAKYGVNRISLGVQDFDETILNAVNRQQPFHLSYKAVHLCRAYGIEHVNLDLMYGLPHQTCDSIKKTVELALTLKPARIALFGYAHVPWMKKHMRLIQQSTLPDQDLRYDLFDTASAELVNNGFQTIGIDHFAKPDDPLAHAAKQGTMRRNFQGYTTDATDNLIGLGISSIGKLTDMYVQNAPDMPGYKAAISAGNLPVTRFCPISKDDKRRAVIIERLMCDFQVDLNEICTALGYAPQSFTREIERLQTYVALGFVDIDGTQIKIHDHARLMARNICAVFDSYLSQTDQTPRHASAV